MIAPSQSARPAAKRPETFDVRVLRQTAPGEPQRWERFRVPYEPNMNVISVLQRIAAMAKTAAGADTAPVAWDCNCLEEVCGACTMVINGRVRQSCSALVDKLLDDRPGEIELRPMSKFPVLRDLVVDRRRMFRGLERVKAWAPVDDYLDRGRGPNESQASQETRYPLSECMTCGCCLEACPQYTKVELEQKAGESDAAFEARQQKAYDTEFVGAQVISQAILFNEHGAGKMAKGERLEALMGPGGVQVCGNAQNCVAVCPKEIPLTRSIAKAGRQTTLYAIGKFFDR
ncbi:Fumarate reductase iron-sulfur subunit [Pseudobythopirellula maris]|uniref:Fumarate reductase iron-sulfur subunit n=1 Tax=Pseudobythopirellula maris TaxID=2527991 RepID=A0A5C5ZMB6_9BACT|nr:succinate dehydrogenase iron-sulfur subunit [Pseudobythopirellula maris]TWT88549.1 Fumarate reductase iron-sulfur subunit [Pseudobythopirellula maris]